MTIDGQRRQPSRSSLHSIAGIALLAVAALYFSFRNISESSFSLQSDEIIHLRVMHEMHRNASYWTPTHDGLPYFQKPPLKMWLTQIPLLIFGESNFGYRAIDASIGVLTVAATLLLGIRVFASPFAGILAGLLILGIKPFVLEEHGFRRATQDGMLVLLIIISYLPLWRWLTANGSRSKSDRPRHTRTAVLFGATVGAAVMTKSYAGFLPLLVAFALAAQLILAGLLFKTRRAQFYRMLPAGGATAIAVAAAFAIPAVWFLPHYLASDGAMQGALHSEIQMRAISGFHRSEGRWVYLQRIFTADLLNSSAVVAAALLYAFWIFALSKRSAAEKLSTWFMLNLALVPIALYTAFPSRLIWYIAPALPPLALIAGKFLVDCLAYCRNHFAAAAAAGGYKRIVHLGAAAAALAFPALAGVEAWSDLRVVARAIEAERRERLPLDWMQETVAGKLAKSTCKFLTIGRPIDRRANPRAGVFNVEALYWGFLDGFAQPLDTTMQAQAMVDENFCGFVAGAYDQVSSLVHSLPHHRIPDSYLELEPFHVRKKPLLILAYGADIAGSAPFRPWKDLIDFGEPDVPVLYGFDPPELTENLTVAFNSAARSAVLLPGSRLRAELGATALLNVGYVQPYLNEPLVLDVYVNETRVAELNLVRNSLNTYRFAVAPGTFSAGINEVKFVGRYVDRQFRDSDRVLMYNWLSLRPAAD